MKKKISAPILSILILLSSCGSDDLITKPTNQTVKVKFSSGIISSQKTRITGNDGNLWEGNETIGIFMLKNNTYNIVENAENINYKVTSSGEKTTLEIIDSKKTIYYPSKNNETVDFLAYYPFKTISNFIFPLDISNQTSQTGIDLIVAKADNQKKGFDKNYVDHINLIFNHSLSKVILNIKSGTGVPDISKLDIKVKGFNTKANIDLRSLAMNQSTITDITPLNKGNNTYEMIIIPTTLDEKNYIEFKINDDIYKWNITNNPSNIKKFEAGKKYIFDVIIQKYPISAGSVVTAWEAIGGGTVIAD